jgi:hypothetical protein
MTRWWSFRQVERIVAPLERDGAGATRWHVFQGWTVVALAVVAIVGLGGSLLAIAVDPRRWPAAVAFGVLAMPFVVVLNAAVLFARLRRASPVRYALETRGRGFVAHVGWAGRSILSVLHGSVVRLSAAAAELPAGVRTHVSATLLLHRIAFGLLIAVAAGALVAAAYLRLAR